MNEFDLIGRTAEERQRYFERLCAMDEQEFQKLWESSDVYAKLKQQQAKIEALKDSNEHLAVLLAEAKAEVAREIFEELTNPLGIVEGHPGLYTISEADLAELRAKCETRGKQWLKQK